MSNLISSIKKDTTSLIQNHCPNFSWQEGFGIFSVGTPALELVKNYVNNQEDHHKTRSFEDEWNDILGDKFIV